MSKRGRPVRSNIRQNIIDILQYMKRGYGYDIYKVYVQLFPKVTMRSIYYHLKKGVALEEIRIEKVEKEKGKFSWGDEVEKTYYSIGKNGNPRNVAHVKEFFEKRQARQ